MSASILYHAHGIGRFHMIYKENYPWYWTAKTVPAAFDLLHFIDGTANDQVIDLLKIRGFR